MTVTSRQVRASNLMAASVAALLFSAPAFADKGGVPNEHASDQARGAAAAAGHRQDGDVTPGRPLHAQVLFAGIVPSATATTSMLQFTNAGDTAGTATVTLYDAATGASLAAWTSASIAPKASLIVDAATLAAKATPALTTTQAGAPVTLGVTATLHGTVQFLQLTGGVLSNVSPCGPNHHAVIGGVPGPGSVAGAGIVTLTNRGNDTAHATVTLYDSATGASLGVWTSPDLPAHGSLVVSSTVIAAAANPIVAATTTSFTLSAGHGAVVVDVLSMPKAGGAATSLDNACVLKGAGTAHAQDGKDGDHDD